MRKNVLRLVLVAIVIAILAGCENPTSPAPGPHKIADDLSSLVTD